MTPPPQPRHRERVDPERAWSEAGPALVLWATARGLKSAPFSGGALDSWPAWALEAWPILDAEMAAVEGALRREDGRHD